MALDTSPEAREIQKNIRQGIFYKSFLVAGLEGWYVEFGSFRGHSFQSAYHAARQVYEEIAADHYGGAHGKHDDKEARAKEMAHKWMAMRFVAFDSFEGIPASKNEVDKVYEVFTEGQYSCSEDEFRENITKSGVNDGQVITVPGFFEDSLKPETAARIGLKTISVCHIDSDLYESAVLALDFCTPYFVDGSIVIFDEWFQFRGNPYLGEQLAFSEWLERNPRWVANEHQQQGAWSKSFILSLRPEIARVIKKKPKGS